MEREHGDLGGLIFGNVDRERWRNRPEDDRSRVHQVKPGRWLAQCPGSRVHVAEHPTTAAQSAAEEVGDVVYVVCMRISDW